jgi:hypothetical protein
MKTLPILPPVTRPWPEKISRRHAPALTAEADGFRLYRPCLRWEFGFSCAFCLIHERDIKFSGVEGWGLTEVEHFAPKSSSPAEKNVYVNCFLICGRCNRVRGRKAIRHEGGGRLLNPCEEAWADHFVALGSELLPRHKTDTDAAYTWKTYRLDAVGKKVMRSVRREKIEESRRFLANTAASRRELLELAGSGRPEIIKTTKALTRMRWQAIKDLVRLMAIPQDRNKSCRCLHHHNGHLSLPKALDDQTFDLVDLLPEPSQKKLQAPGE